MAIKNNELIQSYCEKGHKILKEKYWEAYDEIVPIRLDDLYRGMELDAFLEIIELYDKHRDLKLCATKFEAQNHSGWSSALVAHLIYDFHDEGDKIVRALGFDCKDKEVK